MDYYIYTSFLNHFQHRMEKCIHIMPDKSFFILNDLGNGYAISAANVKRMFNLPVRTFWVPEDKFNKIAQKIRK